MSSNDFSERLVFQNKLVQVKSKNNLIMGNNRLIATIGVEELVIVDNQDSLLIAKRGLEENMRGLLSALNKKKLTEVKENIFERRPWGRFDVLCNEKNFKIKKIILNPNSKLSTQFHYFRSEHWFVIHGIGTVFKDGKTIKLKKGQSIDIPKKCVHYIENKTKNFLVFIEIQLGSYFGEDDIIRIADVYGRK